MTPSTFREAKKKSSRDWKDRDHIWKDMMASSSSEYLPKIGRRPVYTDTLGVLYLCEFTVHRISYEFHWNPDVIEWMDLNLSGIPEFDCHSSGGIYFKSIHDLTLFRIKYPEHNYRTFSWDRISLWDRVIKWMRDKL